MQYTVPPHLWNRLKNKTELPWWWDRSPPANAGDTGSVPGPGRFHMPRRSWARVPQLLPLSAATTEACGPRACAPPQGKPLQWEALLQGIFPTQGLNPCLPHWQADSLLAEPPEKPCLFLLPATNSTKLSIDMKMKTEWGTSTLQSYPALNQNWIMPVTTAWMDRVITILSWRRLRDKDTYHKVSLTGIFLKLM